MRRRSEGSLTAAFSMVWAIAEARASCVIQFTLDRELLNSFAQRRPRDPEDLGSMHLISVGLFQRLNHQFSFHLGNYLEFGITPSPLEKLPRQQRDVRRPAVPAGSGNRGNCPGGRSFTNNF